MRFVFKLFKLETYCICLERWKNVKRLKLIWNPSALEREIHSQGIKGKPTVELNEFWNYKFPWFGNILVSTQLHFQECRRAEMYSWQLSCLLFRSFLLCAPICWLPGGRAALHAGFLSPQVPPDSVGAGAPSCVGVPSHGMPVLLRESS